jgi:hypothetical protein
MEKNNKTLKRGWLRFYTIFLITYGFFFYVILKIDLLYLIPFLVILLGNTERFFRKDSRDVTWKDLISRIYKRKN